MRIAVLGSNGQLGSDLIGALGGHDPIPLTRSDFDVTDRDAMSERLTAASPDVIVNTTAFHKVDLCETEAASAFGVNTVAVYDLATIANALGAMLVHVSTDYVLSGDGSHPLSEDAPPAPTCVYARSKLAGEYVARNVADRHLVIRTCGLYGVAGNSGRGGNFVETMLGMARAGKVPSVVDDQIVTPTWSADLAAQIVIMLEENLDGLVHASAEGSCSWYQFAAAAIEMCGFGNAVTPTTSAAFNAPAKRPAYSVLENARLKERGLHRMLDWREGLSRYLGVKHGIPRP